MFNKYWREYPWFFQLIQFIILLFICSVFFIIVSKFAVPVLTGVSLEEIIGINADSSPKVRLAMFLFNGMGHMGIFLIPCLLFAFATHPRPAQYLGMKPVANVSHWLIVLILSLAAVPVVGGLGGLIDKIPLGKDLETAKDAFAAQQKAIMTLNTTAEFIAALVMTSLIAAFGEEFLFRGIMMKFAAKRINGIFLPVLVSSIFFGLMHGNVVGFIPLIISGMLLGYVYYLTGSILLSVFSHAVVNSTQVILIYFGRNSTELTQMMDSNDIPWGIFLGGIALLAVSFYWLWKTRTPLPANWTDDFTAEEREQGMGKKNLF